VNTTAKRKAQRGKIYVATRSFVVTFGGRTHNIVGGRTRVREGHELLAGREHLFREEQVEYEVEDATADPGAKRGQA
jgi:hypothetical protein